MTILRILIIMGGFVLGISGCAPVPEVASAKCGYISIERQGVHNRKSSWRHVIKSEEDLCRFDFLFGKLEETISKEHYAKYKGTPVPFYPGSLCGDVFYIRFYDSRGLEKGPMIITRGRIQAPLVGRGERRDGCVFFCTRGEMGIRADA